jgi:hypothetical protein
MFSPRTPFAGQFAVRVVVCFLCSFVALTALAQSGRRLPGSPAVSAPTPEVTPDEKKPDAKDKPRQPLIIGAARGDAFAGIPSYYSDSVLQSCIARLDQSHAVNLEVVPREMTRSDAVKRAHAEKETFVVWLELRADNSFASNTSNNNLDSIYIEFTVLEPTTAKVVAHGNCYQGAYRKGGVSLPPSVGRSNTGVTESRLRDAAQDAADRILKALTIAPPSEIPIHPLATVPRNPAPLVLGFNRSRRLNQLSE